MGTKINMIPIQALLAYQQIIEVASREMHDFFGKVTKEQKAGKVSVSYKDILEKKLAGKIRANNIIVTDIEKEMYKRIITAFGRGATTSKIMTSLYREYNIEEEKFTKIKEGRKKQTLDVQDSRHIIKKLDTDVSSEKKK